MSGQWGRSVLGYQGRPARLTLDVAVRGHRLWSYDADLASEHFRGGHGAAARHLEVQLHRILRDSDWKAIERVDVRAFANGLPVASRGVHVYPRMSEEDRRDLVAAMVHWLSSWLAAGALPIGEATPLWAAEGRVVG